MLSQVARRVFALLALSLVLSACQSPAQSSTSPSSAVRLVSPQEAQALLAGERPFLVDVHVPHQGYLAGTDARIPYDEVEAHASELPADRDAPILVYCMSGRMSAIAAPNLVRLGYRNVYDLQGGMLAWQAAGYEVRPE